MYPWLALSLCSIVCQLLPVLASSASGSKSAPYLDRNIMAQKEMCDHYYFYIYQRMCSAGLCG